MQDGHIPQDTAEDRQMTIERNWFLKPETSKEWKYLRMVITLSTYLTGDICIWYQQ